ncbi:MAG: CoB--CoM heterodisulfide reductase iron-sulfur subunit A family protein [Spirochaetes bacterium]|nr:CoB--CoM heterodisulfide reductase iron-sulfur subunit A family protein [Spirochaetota bacterium]
MKIGVFVCHCGHNIKHTVNVKRLGDFFKSFPNVVVSEDYPFVCSEPGQDMIKDSIEKYGLDRVVIASCTPSLHGDLFKDLLKKSNLNPFYLRRVSIREHCSWVGDDLEKNSEKAKRLITAGIYGSCHQVPLEEKRVDVTKSALIIGGGVSGLSAALFLSNMGMQVYVAEKEAFLGGQVGKLKNVWPSLKSGSDIIEAMVGELKSRDNVEIYTSTVLKSFEGFFGNYEAVLAGPQGEKKIIIGGVIVSIGFSLFDARLKPELNYGKDERIITTVDFENKFESLNLPEKPRVAILHCVGSRDEQIGKAYCSRICCINSLRVANAVKDKFKDSYVESFYIDMRSHPKGGEEYYEDTQAKGALFTRSNIAEITSGENAIIIRGEDTLLSEPFEREFDLAVLSIGMSNPVDSRDLATLLKITLDKDKFFLEAHIKLRPFDTAVKGILIAGACSGPKDTEESINHGRSAALKLFGFLNLGWAYLDPFISYVNPRRCSGCRMCEHACFSNAIKYDEETRVVHVEEAACQGCGLCNATCPSSAIGLKGYIDSIIDDEINGFLMTV